MKLVLTLSLAFALVLGGGIAVWNVFHHRLGNGRILEELNRQIGQSEIQFSKVSVETAADTGTQRELRVHADGTVTEERFTLRTAETVARSFDAGKFERVRELRRLLAQPDGAAQAAALTAELGAPPADLLAGQYLVSVTPRGAAVAFQGTMIATQGPDGWVLSITSGELSPGRPAGQPRAAFGADARVLDATATERLRRDFAAAAEYAEKFAAAEARRVEIVQRQREERRGALLAGLANGTCYSGLAEPLAGGPPITGLVLEIAGAPASGRQTAAVLRNDGGWAEARAFQGSFELDAEFTVVKLSLATRSSQAIEQAGPLLSARENWTISLQLTSDGKLSGRSAAHQYTFTRLGDAERERLRTEANAPFEQALAATQAGLVYRGVAVAKEGSLEEKILVRFVKQEKNGQQVSAELELEHTAGRSRTFRGAISANRYRSGGAPIRLASEARQRLAWAGDASIAGLNRDVVLALTPDERTLVGNDAAFSYRLTRLDAAAATQLETERKAARDSFFAVVKRGASLDGIAAHTDGFSTPVRLKFSQVNADAGIVEGTLESAAQNGVNTRLTGRFSLADRSLRFSATVSKASSNNALRLPLFARTARGNIVLSVGDNVLTGTLDGSSAWSFRFPVPTN